VGAEAPYGFGKLLRKRPCPGSRAGGAHVFQPLSKLGGGSDAKRTDGSAQAMGPGPERDGVCCVDGREDVLELRLGVVDEQLRQLTNERLITVLRDERLRVECSRHAGCGSGERVQAATQRRGIARTITDSNLRQR
jgi:hypothetical protein